MTPQVRWRPADSPVYQVRVLGEFPRVSDDNVVALGQLEASYRRTTAKTSPAVIAVDVARFGSDETVIAVRHGNHVRIHKVLAGKDTMEVTGAVFQTARDVKRMGVDWPVIVIDDPGVGGGVTDRLKELREKRLGGSRVVAHNGGGRAYDARDYPNRRSELWFTFADRLPSSTSTSDDQLAADLVAPKYKRSTRAAAACSSRRSRHEAAARPVP
jgi:phage terminase large subunit